MYIYVCIYICVYIYMYIYIGQTGGHMAGAWILYRQKKKWRDEGGGGGVALVVHNPNLMLC